VRRGPLAAYLTATAVVCGALVMVIEVLGSRVIGPFFGVSLFVWTALITVTLIALAAGYALGGWLSDRHAQADLLYLIVAAAGLLVLLVPLVKAPVLKACVALGLRAGSFGAALALFGPPLLLLGCVTPFIIKLIAREYARLGRTVGLLTALSTLGSFVGTLATGFLLIAWLGVDRIFQLTGAALLALATGYFVLFRRRWAALALCAAPLVLQPAAPTRARVMADGTRVEVVHARDSFYGRLKVVDYRFGARHNRELVIDGLVQGGIDLRDRRSVYEYAYLLQWLPRAARPQGQRALVIGLGMGAVPTWYAAQGVRTESVEIDPAVVEIAERYFGFDAAGVTVADARAFLAASAGGYDYIVMDAYTGDSAPSHLLSVEALRLVRARLAPRGVAAFNLHGSLGADRGMTLALLRTLQAVFAELRVYALFSPARGESWGNLVVLAGDDLGPLPPANAFAALPVHPLAERRVRDSVRAPLALPDLSGALLLTDNYNPLDVLDLKLREAVRRDVLANTHWDILLD